MAWPSNSGTIGPLTSKTPAIDVKAQLTVKTEALGAYVPGIAGYGGRDSRQPDPGRFQPREISLVASSPALPSGR